MDIDYEGLYARDYFGHDAGATSFHERFHERLAELAAELGCAGLVDVGSGNGELVRRVAALGLPGLGLDYRGDDEGGVLAFNLIGEDSAPALALRPEIARRFDLDAGGQHLTTCLDVLEHIGRNGMASALANLADLAGRWMLVSVSTRPSSQDNLYHATVIPPRTWRKLFQAAGFEVIDRPGVVDLAEHRDYPDDERCRSLNAWRRIDPYGDTHDHEPFYMLLRRREDRDDTGPIDRAALAEAFRSILLIPPPLERPLTAGTHLCFVLGHYQDFHHYRPYWDALDRGSVSVLVRSGALRGVEKSRSRAILAYMKARGIDYREVSTVGEVDWHAMPGERRALVVATESSAGIGHLLNAAFVLAARGAGYRTFQLQHGIWPHADFETPVAFTCDNVLSWSTECRESFLAPSQAPDGSPVTEALVDSVRFLETGCAKFDAYADRSPIRPADLLGDWADAYERSVLVATNLHWPRHAAGATFLPALIKAASARPGVLFLCKLHPVHEADDAMLASLPSNVKVLDEFACLFGNLDTPSLVRACDAVVGTLSTVALEAALADRPFAVFDTANPNAYFGIDPVPIAEFGAEVDRLLDPTNRETLLARHAPFRDHYHRPDLVGLGLERTLRTIDEILDEPVAASPWSDPDFVIARRFSKELAEHYLPGGREQLETLDRHVTAQDARLKGLSDETTFLKNHITFLDGHVAAQDAKLKGYGDQATFLTEHIAAQDALVRSLEEQARELTRHYEATTEHAKALTAKLDTSQEYATALEGHLRRTEEALKLEYEGRLATASELAAAQEQHAEALARIAAAEERGDRLLERLNQARSGLIHARVRLDSAHSKLYATQQKLAPVADLGPFSIGVARRVNRVSKRYPRLANWAKSTLIRARDLKRAIRP